MVAGILLIARYARPTGSEKYYATHKISVRIICQTIKYAVCTPQADDSLKRELTVSCTLAFLLYFRSHSIRLL